MRCGSLLCPLMSQHEGRATILFYFSPKSHAVVILHLCTHRILNYKKYTPYFLQKGTLSQYLVLEIGCVFVIAHLGFYYINIRSN